MLRGVRLHIDWFLGSLEPRNLEKVQLGLGHSYSREKVKFNAKPADTMVIQAIDHLDTLDKDVNMFSRRVREWYSCHFSELANIVNDNYFYAKVVEYESRLSTDELPGLVDLVGDEDKTTQRIMRLVEDMKKIYDYLVGKMRDVAPALAALIESLFRAIKTHGNVPKYGLIFHSSLIGRASARNKGRVARILANKCAIAARVDCFSENNTADFGVNLRKRVEEQIDFYERPEPLTKKSRSKKSTFVDEVVNF
ncbi:hypothetical protein POM88_005308 [Heracleum sosnowskyi]|uniref:Nop domain-containing protein n=1 Tax=Heracleum sosnowskyi TaxID=360622 RepID=A0AAD8JLW8_9APIA|nr:hypothetical protein POM88_005308 [Heracleum sosnowskyi]